jgi:hypothetical protein
MTGPVTQLEPVAIRTLWIVKFRTTVEPPERMHGLEIPEQVVEALGAEKRPPVIITLNGHTWKSRVAIMRGRYLLGLSNANRTAAGVSTGDEVEVEIALDAEPRVVIEPEDFARALDVDPAARAAYDRLAYTHRRAHVLAIEGARQAETRQRRIELALEALRGAAASPSAATGPARRRTPRG